MFNVIARGIGFLASDGDKKFKENTDKEVKKAFHKAMDKTVIVVKKEAENLIKSKFPGSKSSFIKTWKVKRFNTYKKFETALIYNKVPWFSIYENGGTINGKLVIPLSNGKTNNKKWKEKLKSLKNSGNSFFKKINGNVLLFEITGKGKAQPIGIIVNRVNIKKRYDFSKRLKEVSEKTLVKEFEKNIDISKI